jgi:hypothetical protein
MEKLEKAFELHNLSGINAGAHVQQNKYFISLCDTIKFINNMIV